MRILVLNSGSSSIKCASIESATWTRGFEAHVEHIGAEAATLVASDRSLELGAIDHPAAAEVLLAEARRLAAGQSIDAVAHRIVHGGAATEPVVVNARVIAAIENASEFAALHNPAALAVLFAAQRTFADVPHVAVFDTAFHRTLPPYAREYALPRELSRTHALYRAGFHGISHEHVLRAVADHLGVAGDGLRIVSCHLGNGASVAAIEHGRSVDTSMGMTPLEGLVMGTRAGDLDPGIVLHLLRRGRSDAAALEHLLNSESGLKGLTGTADFAAIERRAAAGDADCRHAIDVYVHRLRKYIGAYAAAMGGVDTIAFTGGIGEHSALVRERVSRHLGFLGAALDDDRNRAAQPSADRPVIDIATAQSRVRILVVRADEQLQLAREAARALGA